MFYTNFVHLHVHSHYSMLDGAATVKSIVDMARRFRMPAVAITDHGNMFGTIEFYQYALSRGIKPIIGFEAYVSAKDCKIHTQDNRDTNHLVLLAKNNVGYKNLVKMSTLGYTEGFYYRPRIDHSIIERHSEGIIALSACLNGEIPRALLQGDKEKAKEILEYYQGVFGKENFYVEIQNHGIEDQIRVLPMLIELARECNAPLIATNDNHYANPADWEAQDALLCLGTNAKLEDENRFRFDSKEFYFKSGQEMTKIFEQWPDAIENSVRIAERCNVQIQLGEPFLPKFDLPQGKTSESYLTELCYQGLAKRYGSDNPSEEIIKRLEYELSVIKGMGFCDYFLIVWDFIDYARKNNIPVGPGRGSAAGAIVAYLLGITDIDPIKYDLLFERFLNPDRISMPDIDVDFSDEDRAKVIDYVKEKYGKDRVSLIITFNFILAKSSIRDVGRVMGVPLSDVNRIAKLVPDKPDTHLKDVLHTVPELKNILTNGTAQEKKLLKIAETVDGLVRHAGVHACGVVVSAFDLQDLVPLYVDKDKNIVTQYEKKSVEEIGLLKMDFLGLKTLTIIKNALANVKETTGLELDFENISISESKVYEMLSEGLSLGVFQLESSGMRALLKKLKPSVFEDVIALLAMYRPGPLKSGMVDDFVKRKHGLTETSYLHPDLEPILKDTYGVYLYQEQVMKTSNVLAGFTMGQADELRKAMGKKLVDKMQSLGEKFVKGAINRGVDGELAESIFKLMAGFGEYGFNKSHSAAYAVITYRTAYLKAFYPVEFMAAALSSEMDNSEKLAEYVQECLARGIKILPPDINKSYNLFKVENGNIRYCLSGLKGVGQGAVEQIVIDRELNGPYKSLSELTRRLDTKVINARVLDALIASGALDEFGLKKSQLYAISAEALKTGQNIQKDKSTGQSTFFDLDGDFAESMGPVEITPPEIAELHEKELLLKEKEVFGFYLTRDPYANIATIGAAFDTISLPQTKQTLNKFEEDEAGDNEIQSLCGENQRISGILSSVKKHITKKGETMAFIALEAAGHTLEMAVFPRAYEKYGHKLVVDEPLFTVAQIQDQGDAIKINADVILSLYDFNQPGASRVLLNIPPHCANKENYLAIKEVLRKNRGITPVIINIISENGQKLRLAATNDLSCMLNSVLIQDLKTLCGPENLRVELYQLEVFMKRSGMRPKRYVENSY